MDEAFFGKPTQPAWCLSSCCSAFHPHATFHTQTDLHAFRARLPNNSAANGSRFPVLRCINSIRTIYENTHKHSTRWQRHPLRFTKTHTRTTRCHAPLACWCCCPRAVLFRPGYRPATRQPSGVAGL
eukprot:362691-Chlamydomonas_euryale.AAC.2